MASTNGAALTAHALLLFELPDRDQHISVQDLGPHEFHAFKRLPIELRMKVWTLSLPGPRQYSLSETTYIHVDSKTFRLHLPTSQVDYEARHHALRHYKPLWKWDLCHHHERYVMTSTEPLYFSPEVDSLRVESLDCFTYLHGMLAPMMPSSYWNRRFEEPENFERLNMVRALDIVQTFPFEAKETRYRIRRDGPLLYMKELKDIRTVRLTMSDDGPLVAGHGPWTELTHRAVGLLLLNYFMDDDDDDIPEVTFWEYVEQIESWTKSNPLQCPPLRNIEAMAIVEKGENGENTEE